MKKAIKIFSILCAILVAVFTATFFNSNFKVSADTIEEKFFYYENLEIQFTTYNENILLNTKYTINQEIIEETVDSDQDIEIKVNNTITLNYSNLEFDDKDNISEGKYYYSYIVEENLNIEEIEKIEIINLTLSLYNENSIDNVIYYKTIQNVELPKTIYEDIFNETTGLLPKVVNFFKSAITTLINLFWISGTGLTTYGKLFIIPGGFAVFYKVMKWVKRLIRIR